MERAAQLLETDYSPLGLVSQSYEMLGRKDEATHTVRRALVLIESEIAERPDNVHAIVQGAWALAYLGERKRAQEWARRAMAIDPDDPLDHYNLGCSLARMNKPDQALDLLEACAAKMSPEWIDWVKQDSDLISLHDHPRYKALIARGEASLAALRRDKKAQIFRRLHDLTGSPDHAAGNYQVGSHFLTFPSSAGARIRPLPAGPVGGCGRKTKINTTNLRMGLSYLRRCPGDPETMEPVTSTHLSLPCGSASKRLVTGPRRVIVFVGELTKTLNRRCCRGKDTSVSLSAVATALSRNRRRGVVGRGLAATVSRGRDRTAIDAQTRTWR